MSEETSYDLWVKDLNRKLADFQNTAKDENRKPSSTKTSGPLNVRRSSARQSGNSSKGINVENTSNGSVETPEFSSNTDKSENLKDEKKSRKAAKRQNNEKYLAEKRRKKREKQQRYREAVKNDPVRYEASKQYERARNEKRKKSGKLKAVTDLKPREKRAQQKKWRENSKRYRKKKATETNLQLTLAENNPPTSPEGDILMDFQHPAPRPSNSEGESPSSIAENSVNTSGSSINTSQKKAGQLRARKRRESDKKKIKQLEGELDEAKRKMNKLRVKFHRRMKSNVKLQPNVAEVRSPSPGKAAQQIIKVGPSAVRSELTFTCALKKQLKKNSKSCKTQEEKANFTATVSGSILKKYKFVGKMQDENITTKYLQGKYAMNGKLDKMRKKKRQTRTKRYFELIRKFFTNDENSNLCPGKRDAVSEKKGQKKAVKVQKRFMTDNLKSLHNKFKKEYNARISFNTFVKMKPFWVVRKKFSQRDTCLCAQHENFRLKIAKLHQLKVLNTLSTKELLQKVACDTKNYDCMYNKCDACKVKIIRTECLTPSNDKFYFHEWVTENVKRKNKKGEEKESRITYKRKVYTDTESLIKLINDELPSFAKHVYNVGHQHEFFSKVKQNLKINEAAIIMDYSENYQSNYAREVQSAHFAGSKNQVSLHTGVIYLGKEWDPKKNKIPFCTASDNLSHKAEAVWAHLIPIIKHAKSLNEKLTVFHFFSDSPSSQYRNKSNIYLLSKFCKELNIEKATWNWSEHGHGKNSADGIGGLVKRTADAKICQERDIVDAETFLDNVKQLKVHFVLITAEEIDRIRSAIAVEDLVPIKGTLQLHQVTWRNDASTDVGIRTLSCFPCISTCKCGHYPLKPGVVPVRKVSTEAEPASSTQKTRSTRQKTRS